MRCALFVIGALGMVPNVVVAQSRDSLKPPLDSAAVVAAPACCSIVRIDRAVSTVTARETATGFTFRFTVKNRRLIASLKVGQPVWADFAAKQVRLKATDSASCCPIVESPPPEELSARVR